MTKKSLLTLIIYMISPTFSAVQAGEAWVNAIRSSSVWASFPCKDYLITVACGTAKDYSDPGNLPPIIKVGDTIKYTDKDGERRTFHVKAINFFIFDRDVDTAYGGQRLKARKGETTCSLYETTKVFRSPDYLSKIVVKGCIPLR